MVGVGLTKYRSRNGDWPRQHRRYRNLRKKYVGDNAALDETLGVIMGEGRLVGSKRKNEPRRKCKPWTAKRGRDLQFFRLTVLLAGRSGLKTRPRGAVR